MGFVVIHKNCQIYVCNPCFSRFYPVRYANMVPPKFSVPPQNNSSQSRISHIVLNKSDRLPQRIYWGFPQLLLGTSCPSGCCHLCWAPHLLLLRTANSTLRCYAAFKFPPPPLPHKFRTWLFGQTSYFQLIHFDESFSDLSLMKIDFWKWSLWVAHWRTRLKVGTKST